MSLNSTRPKPVFNNGDLQFSTKKDKKLAHRLLKSAPKFQRRTPVPRIYSPSYISQTSPRSISFKDNSNNSFIHDSQSYNTQKEESFFEQCFIIEATLGCGSFGEVYRVRNKDDGKVYACKKTLMKYRGSFDRLQRIEEVRKLQQLPAHINCVKFFHAWEENLHLFLLTEACMASLYDVSLRKKLTEDEVWTYAGDILQGLNHLHMNKLIHMDLKPENIFVGMDNVCKIGDFGLVIDFSKGYPKEAKEGDARYLAPECLRGVFTPAADMFCFGMTVLELVTDLDLPAGGSREWDKLRLGKLPPIVKDISCEMTSFLLCLLNPDPCKRTTASDLLNLPYVKKRITKRSLRRSFLKGVSKLYCYLEPIFLWTYFIFSIIVSFLRDYNLFKYRRKDMLDVTPIFDQSSTPENSYITSNLNRTRIGNLEDFSLDEPDNLSFHQPIINSTPISSLKGTAFQSFRNYSEKSSKNSDLLVLDSSENCSEKMTSQENDKAAKSMLGTSRNLLQLFNSAADSDDE